MIDEKDSVQGMSGSGQAAEERMSDEVCCCSCLYSMLWYSMPSML